MKRFINYLISILIGTIVLLYVADFIYTQVYVHANPRNKLQYILNTKHKNFDIVFMGSSRVANHINTTLFDAISNLKTINLGVEGAGLNDNLLQLKLLVKNNKISNVFLQVDDNYQSINPTNIAISEAMPFIRNEIIKNHLSNYFENYKKLQYIPFYRYAVNDPKIGFREVFFSILNKKPKTNPSIGFTPKFGSKLPFVENSFPKQIRNNNVVLNEIIEICQQNNIQLITFIAPYCSKTKNSSYIKQLKVKLPNLIDLSIGYNDSLFFNCGHLNNIGANIFTTNLYNETKDLLK
jgi:hypothetical protein